MNTPPLPLEALTLHPRHHRAALWWLGCLVRNPEVFFREMAGKNGFVVLVTTARFLSHWLPWLLLLTILCRFLQTDVLLEAPWTTKWALRPISERLLFNVADTTKRFIVGVVLALVIWLALQVCSLRRVALVFWVAIAVPIVLLYATSIGPIDSTRFTALGISAYVFQAFVIGLWTTAILTVLSNRLLIAGSVVTMTLGVGFILSIAIMLVGDAIGHGNRLRCGWETMLGFVIGGLRLFYLPAHFVFLFLRTKPNCFRYHPVAWDSLCWTPFPWLDRMLVKYTEADPVRMEPEVQRLLREVPGQRSAALSAFTILRARSAARLSALSQVSEALAGLPEGEKGYLSQTRRVRELAEAIVRQQLRVDATDRPYFRDIEARNLVAEVRNFQARISGLNEPLATEFRKASEAWLKLAEAQATQATAAVQAEPAPQVFRAGDPVEGGQEAFVPRFRVLEELEGQVMLGSGCPGVLLRAPRRMGKSSLLKNVSGFLPKEVTVAFVSLQSARLFSSTAHFVGGLAEAVEGGLPALAQLDSVKQSVRSNRPADLAGFLRFLGACNTALEHAGWRLLLALDEYEMLDKKLREGVFTTDLLATLRESIQSHRRIIWAFSGNADITELTGADWTSYLISVRTLEVPLFTPEETHLLLTEPLKHSALREEDKAKSALFWREFWGERGIARIHAESGGWPYFVQLIAETAVTLANESAPGVKPLPPALLERALNESVSRGRNAFHQLLRSQCRVAGEWDYLAEFARRESQPPPGDAEVRRLLKRRQLLAGTPGGEWRLVVPLMARWLRKEG